MAQLSEEERIAKARSIFDQFDSNHDGAVNFEEFARAVAASG